MKKIILLCMVIGSLNAKEAKEKEEIKHIKIGNFALPERQEPDPLIGFGQIVVEEGDFQVFVYPDLLKGHKKNFKEVLPIVRYGIKDNLVLLAQLPIALDLKMDGHTSRGVEDLLVLLEWAPFDKDTETTVDQITLVGAITLPTGSAFKNPPTGFGAPSFFLGSTAAHKNPDWYYWGAVGGTLTTHAKCHTKFGNQLLYQLGLCKNVSYNEDTYLLNWMLELDGIYRQRNKIMGKIDKNSGGNQISLTPSLWFSTQRIIIQAGISAFIFQNLFGKQNKDKYYIAFNFGWTFN